MKKKTGIMLALFLILVLCSACQVRNVTKGMEEGEHYDAVISIKKPDENTDKLDEFGVTKEDISVLQTMCDMPGMTDEEAADLMGGGEENFTADQSYLIGRNYMVSLFGEECAVYTSYGSEEQVELAYVILPEKEISWYGEILTLLYGEADIYCDENGAALEWSWKKDGKLIWLYQDESIILDYSLDSSGEYGE